MNGLSFVGTNSTSSHLCMFAKAPISLHCNNALPKNANHAKKVLFFSRIHSCARYVFPDVYCTVWRSDGSRYFPFYWPPLTALRKRLKVKKIECTTNAIFHPLSDMYGEGISSYFVWSDNAGVDDAVSFGGDACSADDAFAPPDPVSIGPFGSESSSWKPRFLKLSLPISPLFPLAKGKKMNEKKEVEYKEKKMPPLVHLKIKQNLNFPPNRRLRK